MKIEATFKLVAALIAIGVIVALTIPSEVVNGARLSAQYLQQAAHAKR